MKHLKKLFIAVVCAAMLTGLFSVSAFASTNEVEVGTADELREAIDQASTDTVIKLKNDITVDQLGINIDTGKTITLDLGNYTLIGKTTSMPTITNIGNLTITCSDGNTGSVANSDIYYGIYNGPNGHLTINGGTYTAVSDNLLSGYGGTTVVNKGTFNKPIDTGMIAEGSVYVSLQSNGVTTYYVGTAADIAEKTCNIADDGDTIHVLKGDIDYTGLNCSTWLENRGDGIVIRGSLTLKNGGHSGGAHSYERVEKVLPTCTEDGTETYFKCSVCSRCADFSANKITDMSTISIPATGHDGVHYDYKAPTETEKGNLEYWQCETCKKYFLDADLKIPVEWDQIELAALGKAETEEESEEETEAPAETTPAASAPTEQAAVQTIQTGDSSHMILWIGAAVLGAAAITAATVLYKKLNRR